MNPRKIRESNFFYSRRMAVSRQRNLDQPPFIRWQTVVAAWFSATLKVGARNREDVQMDTRRFGNLPPHKTQLFKADLLTFWISLVGPKRLTFYLQVLWASEKKEGTSPIKRGVHSWTMGTMRLREKHPTAYVLASSPGGFLRAHNDKRSITWGFSS